MRRLVPIVLTLVLALSACGGDDGLDAVPDGLGDVGDATDEQEAADAIAEAMGAGGGGTLVFDGTERTIDSAVCQLGDRIDVGTVGPDGYRVLISGEPDDLSVQILEPGFGQWFANNDVVTQSGSTFTSDGDTYFNNNDDREIEAAFEIECP